MIDGWLKLMAPAQTAVIFKELRLMLHSVLKSLIRNPEVLLFASLSSEIREYFEVDLYVYED